MKLVVTTNELFERLFTIRLVHAGFDSPNESMISDHITIKPDKETKKLMKDYRIGQKFADDNFVCYIQSRLMSPPAPTPKAAYIIPGPGTKLRFLLDVSTYFMDATELEPTATGKGYYFSNRSNAASGMFISHDAGNVNNNDVTNITDVDVREKYIGVIDIFCDSAANNSYELFSGTAGRLRSPEYRLSFRSTL